MTSQKMSIQVGSRVSVVGLLQIFFLAIPISSYGIGAELEYPEFSEPDGDEYTSEDGTVALAWSDDPERDSSNRVFETRRWKEGGDPEGILVYEGPDTATFLSGLPEGEYELKVRSRPETGEYPDWGESSLTVNIDYIDEEIVVGMMTAGFLTFVGIVGTIAFGHRKSLREGTRSD